MSWGGGGGCVCRIHRSQCEEQGGRRLVLGCLQREREREREIPCSKGLLEGIGTPLHRSDDVCVHGRGQTWVNV